MHFSFYAVAALILVTGAKCSGFNCLPGQSCWPTPSQWAAFNKSIDGSLRVTTPLASPCYLNSPDYNPAVCAQVEANYSDATTRSDRYGATQNLQWEVCGAAQCEVNVLSPQTPPIAGNCSLGSLSAYYVVAGAHTHIRATLAFVRKHNIRLSIKNSGHDYMGRSVAANSLALWTRNLKTLQYRKNFSASKCPAANNKDVGIIGAGVNAQEAAEYFQALGFDVTVGANPTVGLAGGFGQGGGHGVFAPSYGLMVDQAIEFDVITADGSSKTINQCNDPDLFWAMRGGGGSTYAVLTQYKFKVHPIQMISQFVFTANIEPSAQVADFTQSAVYRGLFTALVANQSTWSANNITGNYFFAPDSISMFFILPTNLPLDHLKNLTAKFSTHISSLPGLNITTNLYAQGPHAEVGGGGQGGSPAFSVVAAGRLIPSYLFEPSNATVLVNTMLQAMTNAAQLNFPQSPIQMQIYASTPANHPDGSATGVNPAWRGSLWHLLMVTGYVQGSPQELVDSFWKYARLGTKPFIDLLPGGGGCYMNEADYGEEDWQNAFFGSNYPRLLEIKRRYDPEGLFNCWKCVGWSPSDPMFSCYGSEPFPTVPMGPVS